MNEPCPRCGSVLTYLNQDEDMQCANCGRVTYITGSPLTLEDMADVERPRHRLREPRIGNRGKGWM